MQTIESKSLVDKIVRRIHDQIKPDKIILFGSYAYGSPDNESDIDILIVKDIKKNEVRKYRLFIKKLLRDIMLKTDTDIDIIVDSWERIRERINLGDLFLKEITEKGKVIYGK